MTKKLPTAADNRGDVQDTLGAISWDKRMADARARRAKVLASRAPQNVANDAGSASATERTSALSAADPAMTDVPPEWMTDGVSAREHNPSGPPPVMTHFPRAEVEADPFAAPKRARRIAVAGYIAGAFAFGIVAALAVLALTRVPTPETLLATPTVAPTAPTAPVVAPVPAAPVATDTASVAVPAPVDSLEASAPAELQSGPLAPENSPLGPRNADVPVPPLTAALAITVPQLAPTSSAGVPAMLLSSRTFPTEAVMQAPLVPPALDTTPPRLDVSLPPADAETTWAPRGLAIATERDYRVVMTANQAMGAARFESFVAAAEAIGIPLAATQRVGFTITSDQVRFFHGDDAAAAGLLSDALGAEIRDFTDFSPKPPLGTLEIYLSNTADAPPLIDSAQTERERLQQRLLNSLQRGDHL
ncbi:MAG: hypothetical protein AAF601_17065 [Pseudomonadota bacterium]